MKSDDPECKKTAIQQACDCASGRLVAYEKESGKPIEQKFERSIGLIEEVPEEKLSGPIWIRGGVTLEGSDGKMYEVRNRMALCRCGKSRNKPFCDGSHIRARFSDER
jgi:vacuolar-type H+-ATPase subunit E/Vma4